MDVNEQCDEHQHENLHIGQHAVLAAAEVWRVQRPAVASVEGAAREIAPACVNSQGYLSAAMRPLLHYMVSFGCKSVTCHACHSARAAVLSRASALLSQTVPMSGDIEGAMTNSKAWSNSDGHVGANWRRHIVKLVAGLSDTAWLSHAVDEGCFDHVSTNRDWLHGYAVRDSKAGMFIPWTKLHSKGQSATEAPGTTSPILPPQASVAVNSAGCCAGYCTVACAAPVHSTAHMHSAVPLHGDGMLNDTAVSSLPVLSTAHQACAPGGTGSAHSKYEHPKVTEHSRAWSDERVDQAAPSRATRPSIRVRDGGGAVGPLPLSPNPPTPGPSKAARGGVRSAAVVKPYLASPTRSVGGVSLHLRGASAETGSLSTSPVRRVLDFWSPAATASFSHQASRPLDDLGQSLLQAATKNTPDGHTSDTPWVSAHRPLTGLFASVLDAARQRLFQVAVRHTLVLLHSAAGSSSTQSVLQLAASQTGSSKPQVVEHLCSHPTQGVYCSKSPPYTLFEALIETGTLREHTVPETNTSTVTPLHPIDHRGKPSLHPSALSSSVAECVLVVHTAFRGGGSTPPMGAAALGHHAAFICPPSPWVIALLKVFLVPLSHTLSAVHPAVAAVLLLASVNACVGGLLSALRWGVEADGVFKQKHAVPPPGKSRTGIVRIPAEHGATFKGVRPPPCQGGPSVTHFGGVQLCADLLFLRCWVTLGGPIAPQQAAASAPPVPERCVTPLNTLHMLGECAFAAARGGWGMHVRGPLCSEHTGPPTAVSSEASPSTPLAREWFEGAPLAPCLPPHLAAVAGASECWHFAHDVLKRLTPPAPPSTPSSAPGGFTLPGDGGPISPGDGGTADLRLSNAAASLVAASAEGPARSSTQRTRVSDTGRHAAAAFEGGGIEAIHGAPSEWISAHDHTCDTAAQQWLVKASSHGMFSADASALLLPGAFLGCS